jgi:murein DD-endopeptidase MepM/ murein hydrolase activator NlpD
LTRGIWLRFALSLGILAFAAVLTANGRWPWRRLDQTSTVESVMSLAPVRVVQSDTLRRGETLSDLLLRQGLLPGSLIGLLQRSGLDPRRLRAGLVLRFGRRAEEAVPNEIRVRVSPTVRLALWREDTAWTAAPEPVAWHRDSLRFDGPIASSLYDALDQRIRDDVLDPQNRVRLAWDLADIYAWSLDFNRDIQDGDRFAVLVERETSDEGEVRLGRILAADLFSSGRHLKAYRFEVPGQGARYFDGDGNSLRRAFLRAPVEFRRIASGFSRSRFHPILGTWRAHQGTDYSATVGTPVLASGDGIVTQAGWSGGYGNLIEVRHRNGITTRYGHLHGFASDLKVGTRVSQGEVIGYVGSTGLSTGPHLHYEFRVNGVARDSRRMDLGPGDPLPESLKAVFRVEQGRLTEQLNGVPRALSAGG